jgi:hypothetical protein
MRPVTSQHQGKEGAEAMAINGMHLTRVGKSDEVHAKEQNKRREWSGHTHADQLHRIKDAQAEEADSQSGCARRG